MTEHSRDPVSLFVREARGTVSRTDALLRRIAAERAAAVLRTQGLSSPIGHAENDSSAEELLQELEIRDEELRLTVEELQGHVEELERASELLERERMKYYDLFVNAPEAYVSTNVSGIITEANLASACLLASEPRSLVGRPLISFVARQDTRAFRMHLKTLGELNGNHEPPSTCRVRMRPRGQTPFAVSLRSTVVRTSSEKLCAIRWNLCRMASDDLETANEVTDEDIIGPLARNLRGTLATIGAWAQMLREGQLPGVEESQQALEWIEHTATSQRTVLDQLVETLETGNEGGLPLSVDLSERVLKAVGSVAISEEPNRITVRGLEPAGAAPVRAPPKRLQRVIELLLRRALDGTPRNGAQVVVGVRLAADEAVVDIETPDTARAPLGWELRTTVAARIVREYGGFLAFSDETATVRLRLPLIGRPPPAGGGDEDQARQRVRPYPE